MSASQLEDCSPSKKVCRRVGNFASQWKMSEAVHVTDCINWIYPVAEQRSIAYIMDRRGMHLEYTGLLILQY